MGPQETDRGPIRYVNIEAAVSVESCSDRTQGSRQENLIPIYISLAIQRTRAANDMYSKSSLSNLPLRETLARDILPNLAPNR